MSDRSISSSSFPRSVSVVLALLTRRDVERARAAPGFRAWASHRAYIAERDALHLSYGTAGVAVHKQRVPFDAFERWARLTGAPLGVDGLDEFATHWRWRLDHPEAPTLGRFGAPGDPERRAVDAGGAQCLVVLRDVYMRWRDEFARSGLLAPPDLDAYATQVVECCLARPRAVRRAVNSA